jgi:endonuclease YncB( thermonuclease family)
MGNALATRNKKKAINKLQVYKDIPFFSYKGEQDLCKVSKCYDGDTIHIIRIIKKKPYRFSCRLLGIDTAELRTKNEKEKEFAIETRDFLANLILDKYVWVEFEHFDKYGRVLCNIYLSHTNMKHKKSINQLLIDDGFAQSYDGGTKIEFEDWNIVEKNGLHRIQTIFQK